MEFKVIGLGVSQCTYYVRDVTKYSEGIEFELIYSSTLN